MLCSFPQLSFIYIIDSSNVMVVNYLARRGHESSAGSSRTRRTQTDARSMTNSRCHTVLLLCITLRDLSTDKGGQNVKLGT